MTPKRPNILLADDGSQHAQSAVELLQNISLPSNSRIFVLRAFSSGQIPYLPEYEKALQRTISQLESMGFKVESELKLGGAAELILQFAEARKSDLIVVGAKGLRSTVGILLGGVAQQVVEYACCPVLVVRAPFKRLHRVLLVTDGSTHSQRATRYLGRFPLPKDVELRVMHVLPPLPQPIMMEPRFGGWETAYTVFPSKEEEEQVLEQQNKQGAALLTRTSLLLARQGLAATSMLSRGDAATEIIDYVNSSQVDLIVAGSRGLSEFKGFWMGSVSRKLVHYAPCSVLIVKGPRKE
jgi:nucleotide-binding universal stress UspA family protein